MLFFNSELQASPAYTIDDAMQKITGLEQNLMQLYQRVYQLEANQSQPQGDTWLCTMEAGWLPVKKHSATGANKAVTAHKALTACQEKTSICGDASCSQ